MFTWIGRWSLNVWNMPYCFGGPGLLLIHGMFLYYLFNPSNKVVIWTRSYYKNNRKNTWMSYIAINEGNKRQQAINKSQKNDSYMYTRILTSINVARQLSVIYFVYIMYYRILRNKLELWLMNSSQQPLDVRRIRSIRLIQQCGI